ncbi:MAG: cytochrome C oxidase subunit IV family protein [Gemmatimonadota bacterium]
MSTQTAVHGADDHAHTSGAKYVQIAVILFVLTALEVALYEVAHEAGTDGFAAFLASNFVVILLGLSALKFWYVVMFYMHLKNDTKILSWLFAFSLLIAVVVIFALFVLFTYNRTLWWPGGVWK